MAEILKTCGDIWTNPGRLLLKRGTRMLSRSFSDLLRCVKTTKKVGKSHKKVTTQTQRIKDLTQKLRSSDKLCCDIILIFILLGLIGVLVAIIRQRY